MKIRSIICSALVICLAIITSSTALHAKDSSDDEITQQPETFDEVETNDDNIDENLDELAFEELGDSMDEDEEHQDTLFSEEISQESDSNEVVEESKTTRDARLPLVPTPTFNGVTTPTSFATTKIGETSIQTFGDLSFSNPKGLHLYSIMSYISEKSYNGASRLQKLVVPSFDGKTLDNYYDEISITVMAIVADGSVITPIKTVSSKSAEGMNGFEMTREEIIREANKDTNLGDSMPKVVYFLVTAGVDPNLRSVEEFKIDGPIQMVYTTVDNDQAAIDADKDGYRFGYFNSKVTVKVGDNYANNIEPEIVTEHYHYNYYDTSKISVEADKTTDLLPGDEVELTFTVTNESAYSNVYLYYGFAMDNAEHIGSLDTGTVTLPFSKWKTSKNLNYAYYGNEAGNAYLLPAKATKTFKQVIKIDEAFTGSELSITPFQFHECNNKIVRRDPITLNMRSYELAYDGNGAIEGESPVDTALYSLESTTTLLGFNTLSKKGYTFIGWNTQADGLGTTYLPGDEVELSVLVNANKDKIVTLYAMWDENEFNITYNVNGADAGEAPVDTNKYASGADVTLLGKGTLERSGYTFVGWTTTADGTGTLYKENEVVNIDEILPLTRVVSYDVNLYAKWEVTPVVAEPIDDEVKTGETSNVAMYAVIAVASLAAILFVIERKRKTTK